MEEIEIKPMNHRHLVEVAKIASTSFAGMRDPRESSLWITCNFNAFPRCQYYIAEGKESKKVYGYVLWVEKGGFREDAVWELEQIAVHSDYRGEGIGTRLVRESLKEVKRYVHKRGARLKLVMVSTGTESRVQRFYEKTLGAKVVAVIPGLYRQDEAIMIARGLDLDENPMSS